MTDNLKELEIWTKRYNMFCLMYAEPVYQPIKAQSRRTRSRSGVDSIITAQNVFYETSLNLKPQWNDYDTPGL